MADWISPPELNQPLPRKVRPNARFKWYMATPALIAVFCAVFLGIVTIFVLHKSDVLKTRGIATVATVVKMWTGEKHNYTTYYIAYRYALGVPPLAYEATDTASAANYQKTRIGQTIPVVYDPQKPVRSAMNFDDIVHQDDTSFVVYVAAGIPLGLAALTYAVLLPFLLYQFYRERALLQRGRAAAATIVGEREYALEYGTLAAVTYTYADGQGKVIEGMRGNLPIKKFRKAEKFERMFANPTVIYDPQNSAKNLLYPANFVECISR